MEVIAWQIYCLDNFGWNRKMYLSGKKIIAQIKDLEVIQVQEEFSFKCTMKWIVGKIQVGEMCEISKWWDKDTSFEPFGS